MYIFKTCLFKKKRETEESTNVGKDVKQLELSHAAGGRGKVGLLALNVNTGILHDPESTARYILKRNM